MRRVRPMSELMDDKKFPYHVGQLMGASEMAAHWMLMQEDETTRSMGAKLTEIVNWFFEEKSD